MKQGRAILRNTFAVVAAVKFWFLMAYLWYRRDKTGSWNG